MDENDVWCPENPEYIPPPCEHCGAEYDGFVCCKESEDD